MAPTTIVPFSRRVNDAALVGEILEKHVRHQKRGFKDDEKMAPYTSAGTQGLVVLMRQARAQVTHSLLLGPWTASNLQLFAGERVEALSNDEHPFMAV